MQIKVLNCNDNDSPNVRREGSNEGAHMEQQRETESDRDGIREVNERKLCAFYGR